jgi:outer membrane scaffolding protein for murein synthesis (MipA/OmpV family)
VRFSGILSSLFFLISSFALADDHDVPTQPIWEYGIGAGYVRYEQYPAAGKYSDLFLPFPTFQYRGESLRADDREGAKAYLFKDRNWSLEMAGTGTPALDSDKNENRKGMKDLPWIMALGPQLAYRFGSDWQISWGIFQAMMTDFTYLEVRGSFIQQVLTYRSESSLGDGYVSQSNVFFTLKSASQEVQEKYFGVSTSDATAERQAYHARGGFLSAEVSAFQAFKKGRASYYVGANYDYYGAGVNQHSPLFKAQSQANVLFGITYVLGESKRPEVPEEKTSGIINRQMMRP